MTKTALKTARAAKSITVVDQFGTEATIPARNSKKVLSEKDFLKPGQKTKKEQEAELRRELAVERESIKQPTALARGVESRQNPHSSKALSDERGKAKATPAKAAPKPAPTKAAPKGKADTSAKLTILVKAKDSGLKPGSDRFTRLQAIEKCKTLADALAITIDGGKRIAMDNIRGMEKRGHVSVG